MDFYHHLQVLLLLLRVVVWLHCSAIRWSLRQRRTPVWPESHRILKGDSSRASSPRSVVDSQSGGPLYSRDGEITASDWLSPNSDGSLANQEQHLDSSLLSANIVERRSNKSSNMALGCVNLMPTPLRPFTRSYLVLPSFHSSPSPYMAMWANRACIFPLVFLLDCFRGLDAPASATPAHVFSGKYLPIVRSNGHGTKEEKAPTNVEQARLGPRKRNRKRVSGRNREQKIVGCVDN